MIDTGLNPETHQAKKGWRYALYTVIFGHDTRAGRFFDIVLMWSIILSVVVVMFDSMSEVRAQYGELLFMVEWFFTILFTIEYLLRLISIRQPLAYALSFFGIVDLLAIIPTYLSLVIAGSQYLLVVRILRVLRVFRVLKFVRYIGEARMLMTALRGARRKIMLFLFAVLTIVVVIGSFMYLVEGPENGFTSIPRSIYWAIVTLTTVGYGDISPRTPLGQAFASIIMIIGYGIIAVPTGIVTVELGMARTTRGRACGSCGLSSHEEDAQYCKHCGARLDGPSTAGPHGPPGPEGGP